MDLKEDTHTQYRDLSSAAAESRVASWLGCSEMVQVKLLAYFNLWVSIDHTGSVVNGCVPTHAHYARTNRRARADVKAWLDASACHGIGICAISSFKFSIIIH